MVNATPTFTEDGDLEKIIINFIDITELKNAEDALKKSEKQYRNIVDNSLIGIYKTNLKGDIFYINEALLKIFEYESSAEIIRSGVVALYKDIGDRIALI